MSALAWIIVSGLAMSAIALVGSVSVLMPEPFFRRLVMPLGRAGCRGVAGPTSLTAISARR